MTAALAAAFLLAFHPDAEDLRARAGRVETARVLETRELADSRLEDVRLVGTSGLSALCQVRSPSAAKDARRFPAYLIVAGIETGRRAVTFPDVRGVVLLACDYPLRVPESLEPSAFWRGLPELRRALLDTPATLLLAIDYLAGRPDVDPDAIAVVGASLGVPAATVAAALDTRVRAAAFLYGGADFPLLFSHNVDLGSDAAERIAGVLVRVLSRPVEPARYAGAIAPRPTLAVNAPDDPFIPRTSAEALHDALREPKEVRWIPLDHFAAFHERDLLGELTELTAEWFRARGIG